MASSYTYMIKDPVDKLQSYMPESQWSPVAAWATAPDGSRYRTELQETDAETGKRLWSRYAYLQRVSYSDVKPELIEVRVWSKDNPNDAAPGEFSDDWKEKGNE